MRCLSCNKETEPAELKQWRQMLLCVRCEALATKAETEVIRECETAKANALVWLEGHVLQGHLLRGGNGTDMAPG